MASRVPKPETTDTSTTSPARWSPAALTRAKPPRRGQRPPCVGTPETKLTFVPLSAARQMRAQRVCCSQRHLRRRVTADQQPNECRVSLRGAIPAGDRLKDRGVPAHSATCGLAWRRRRGPSDVDVGRGRRTDSDAHERGKGTMRSWTTAALRRQAPRRRSLVARGAAGPDIAHGSVSS